jgi:putative ABC transport system permease protein
VRQLLIESVLLAVAGGTAGLTLASIGLRALLVLTPGDMPRAQELARFPALDPWVAGFTVLVSVITGVAFGLFPALQLSRPDLTTCLKESGSNAGTSLRHNRARGALVAGEVAMAVVLLCGATLLIRTFVAIHSVQPGFDPENLLTMRVALAGPGNADAVAVDRLVRQTVERLELIPGVEAATVASSLPAQPIVDMIFYIPGRPLRNGSKYTGDELWCFVSLSYFDTLRIPLRSGRLFREQEPRHTVIINEAMAHKFWPRQNPVGQSIVIGAGLGPLDQGPTEIVGVVGDVHDRLDANPTMYRLCSQVPDAAIKLVSQLYPAGIAVRTKPGVAPMSVSRAVEKALLAGDTQLPANKVETMDQVMMDSTAQANFDLVLLGIFAGIALLLAAVGIFGVVSYSVRQRTPEIGIRMALGASRGEVLRLVVAQGMALTVVGVAIGIAGAFGLTRFLAGLLYGVKPADPLTFVVVSLILTGVALFACCIPARRAAKVDPMVALRHQ